ncbi:MAG: hypothetical protein L6437_10585 [Kiritimatiellae bacterium]|nr:hypothetical protein [Kiritimatiellia bacterium]
MKLETPELINLLILATPKMAASELIQKCLEIGMTAQPYRASPQDSNLPAFDVGHQLRFDTDGSLAAGFDVLEKDGLVLQAGFQIFFHRGLFGSKSKKHYQEIVTHIEQHYGPGVPTEAKGIAILNYGDPQTVCYISKTKALGKDVVTVRVGNRIFWG